MQIQEHNKSQDAQDGLYQLNLNSRIRDIPVELIGIHMEILLNLTGLIRGTVAAMLIF
tara:strand:- start:803 stop:976 length:174 start_codon:yes stop_codon:yes gene_type:complete